MDAVSPLNVNASVPTLHDQVQQSPVKKTVSQDEASALALLTQIPAPALAPAGLLGTRLDAWA